MMQRVHTDQGYILDQLSESHPDLYLLVRVSNLYKEGFKIVEIKPKFQMVVRLKRDGSFIDANTGKPVKRIGKVQIRESI